MIAGKKFSTLLLFIIVLIALTVILGWVFDIEVFKRLSPGFAAMHPITAITFMLAAFALILVSYEGQKDFKIFISSLSLGVFILGTLGTARFMNIYDFNINSWLIPQHTASDGNKVVSHIGLNTAIDFIIAGFTIFYLNIKRHKAVFADLFALIIALSGLTALLGYMYGAKEFYKFGGYDMALNTAICFILLSLNILKYKKQAGFTKDVTSENGGRKIAKYFIPIAFILPVMMGGLRVYNEKHHFFSPELNTALAVTILIITLIYFTWRISALINKTNLLLVEEINARKQIEIKLKESNVFLDTLLDEIPAIIFVKEPKDLKYTRVNKAAEEFLKLEKNKVLGRTDFEIFRDEEAALIRKTDMDVLRDTGVFAEEQKVTRNNAERWLSIKKMPFKDHFCDSTYLVGIAQDVTEQKAQKERIEKFNQELEEKVLKRTQQLSNSESRFRFLIENGVDAIKMMDSNGLICYASISNKKVIGFHPDEMVGTNWLSYVHPDEKESALSLMKTTLKFPSEPKQGAFRFLHKKGHYISVEGNITNFLHEESVNALVCNFHEITKRLQIENEKQLLQQELNEEKINRQKEITYVTIDAQEKERTAIAMELHDNINQVLGVIKLYIGMAIKVPSCTKEMLDKSYENVELCINEIRKLSKTLSAPNIETGLSNAINCLIFDVEEASGMTIEFSANDEILEKIDERKQLAFYRILQELLTNVVKHARAENVFVSFSEVKDQIICNFKDDGKGFDITEIRKGLGLKNVQNRVEALNGTFKITSAKDEGCDVRITVPKT